MREGSASAEWRRAAARARRDQEQLHVDAHAADERSVEIWTREDPPAAAAPRSNSRTRRVPSRDRRLPPEVVGELADAGGPRRAPKLQRDLAVATAAYEAGRYPDALRLLRPLAKAAPSAPAVRELFGLTLYRSGRWKAAIEELDAFRSLTDSTDQLPVVADCFRALGRHRKVDELWERLRQASPGVEVLTEARLVKAGSLADRGELAAAIELLARHAGDRAHPRDWHLRTWYALADLYERAGDVPKARELFARILGRDRDFFDVAERLAALR